VRCSNSKTDYIPFVEDRFNKGELYIYGWYYEIGTGAVYNYNPIEKFLNK